MSVFVWASGLAAFGASGSTFWLSSSQHFKHTYIWSSSSISRTFVRSRPTQSPWNQSSQRPQPTMNLKRAWLSFIKITKAPRTTTIWSLFYCHGKQKLINDLFIVPLNVIRSGLKSGDEKFRKTQVNCKNDVVKHSGRAKHTCYCGAFCINHSSCFHPIQSRWQRVALLERLSSQQEHCLE